MTPIEYCIAEVDKQGDEGQLNKYVGMIRAYQYVCAMRRSVLRVNDLLIMGAMINDTDQNHFGYRGMPATFANGDRALKADHIPGQMVLLIDHQLLLEPRDVFQRFQEIHPFKDGNGRVGSLWYNFLSKTLDNPGHAPEFRSVMG